MDLHEYLRHCSARFVKVPMSLPTKLQTQSNFVFCFYIIIAVKCVCLSVYVQLACVHHAGQVAV